MELNSYLATYGVSKSRFAEMCGVTRATISNIIARRKCASVPLALRIEELTQRRVSASSLVSDSYRRRLRIAQAFNEEHYSEE